ncbi:cox cluster protein [Halorubellus sp. JP-L1]|uniref:DUF7541 family protein n=1 Tax=Halorubellus sp. JP-L1 TaxID=2715753 RepID=UPI001409DFDA|nr:cox cluster protein [Halorubellus sp. JP-L1]NHN40149.1 cox cluster protein [Halorubellus sp. JP-L1]
MAKESVENAGTGSEDGNRAVTDHKPSASLWPMFVAFGLAIAEVGVVVGVYVLTIVGVLTFTGAVAGILHEAGYVDDAWTTLGVLAVVVLVAGTAVFALYGGAVGGPALVAVPNAIAYRGLSMMAAGGITLLASVAGFTRKELAVAG